MVGRAAVERIIAIAPAWSVLPLFAAEETGPVLERLDPPKRAVVIMTLLGLVLIGITLIACVMIGAHWVRRLARHKPNDRLPSAGARSAAESARLRESLESILPEATTGDTVQINVSSKDTKVN